MTASDNSARGAARATLYARIKPAPERERLAAIEAAIRRTDPAAQVSALAPGNVLAIETAAHQDAVRDALYAAGCVASFSTTRWRGERTFNLKRLVGQILLWLLVGALALPLATLILMLVIVYFDPVCGGPGDAGGCAMGTFTAVAGAMPLGAVLGLAFGFWRGMR